MMVIKVGDKIVIEGRANYQEVEFYETSTVAQIYWSDESGTCVGVVAKDGEIWSVPPSYYKAVKDVTYTGEHYAAAFNAWMNDYTNCPQDYEDSHTIAIRHLTEKLNGEEPSYGAVCSVLFQEYLNKTREGK